MRKFNLLLFFLIILLFTVSFAGCAKQEATVYFAVETETDFYLKAQKTEVEPSPDLYHASLEALIEGPEADELFATIPSSTRVNSVVVEDGLAIADFSRELLTDTSIPHSSATEYLAIYSIVNTLTEFEDIDKVRITIEGKQSGTIDGLPIEDFWGHIGLGEDFSRNPDIILEDES
ncbi:MAG: GerMN domain-containing protein [Actinomycetota bacterium]